jgi:2-dehydro-3-deoxy-D-gluconate 5-dehydrogenase
MNETKTISQLFDLSGKVAVVTGGAMGIGQAVSFRLTEAGAAVMIADINPDAAKETVGQIQSRGGQAQAVLADVRSSSDAGKVATAAVKAFGSLDILVNNAGVYPLMPFREIKEEMLDRVIDTNLKGLFLFSQTVAEAMIKAGKGGRIVNIASMDALHPSFGASHYSASKGGVVMLTKAMALELAPHGILVNAIAPGSIKTPGSRNCATEFLAAGHDVSELAVERSRYPLRRSGIPDDIARVVLFLVSPAADYVCGSLILVDGGFLLS